MAVRPPTEGRVSRPPSRAVVDAVAVREGVDPADLSGPLYRAVDTDALDALFRADGPAKLDDGACVRFGYAGYEVTVYADGRVELREAAAGSRAGTGPP